MWRERRGCAVSCVLVAICLVRSEARVSRTLLQTAFGIDTSSSPTAFDSSTVDYFAPHWGASFKGTGSPTNQNVWAPAAAPQNSSAIFYMTQPDEIRYTISLQAVLAPGDQVIQVVLAGSIDNSTGERPVIAYLFGVEATSLINQTSLGVDAPAYAANGTAPWELASGVLYAEDITDEAPYLFSELPGRLTGSYSGYNDDPLYVTIQTTRAKEAFIAGIDNGIKPLNAAALAYVDQDTINVGDDDSDSSGSDDASSGPGPAVSSYSVAAAPNAAAPAYLSAATALTDPSLASGTPEPAQGPAAAPGAAPGTSIVATVGAPVGAPAGAPSAAAPADNSAAPTGNSAAVAYGASTFHADLMPSPGVTSNATGLVLFFLSPMESSMHYRIYLRGLSPYALILNVTFFATDGPDNTGTDRLILTKAFGLPNGPNNPTGGFGVPQNGTTFVLTTGDSPDQTVLSVPGNADLEMNRYREFSNALRYNKLRVHMTTVVHPDGLLDGISAVGASKGNWPVPSW